MIKQKLASGLPDKPPALREFLTPHLSSMDEASDWLSLYTQLCFDLGARASVPRQMQSSPSNRSADPMKVHTALAILDVPREMLLLMFEYLDQTPLGVLVDPLFGMKGSCRKLHQHVQHFRLLRPRPIVAVCSPIPVGYSSPFDLPHFVARDARVHELIFVGCVCGKECFWSSTIAKDTFYKGVRQLKALRSLR